MIINHGVRGSYQQLLKTYVIMVVLHHVLGYNKKAQLFLTAVVGFLKLILIMIYLQ